MSRFTRRRDLAHTDPATVEGLLETNLGSADRRAREIHRPAARTLAEPLGYQPGLVQLHGELADTHGYLTALAAAATNPELVTDLTAAADAAGHLTAAVRRAALRTTAAKEVS
jgi:hypothetical protein